MRKIILFLLLGPSLPAQPATFAGTVTNALTRRPLPGVHVTMYILRRGPPEEIYGAISGKDGHFSITAMPPAKYGFTAEHNGFVLLPKPDNGRPIGSIVTLTAGQQLTDFIVEMTPEAVITGRVVDDSGDPVENAFVQATPAGADSRPSGAADYAETDERGQFRIAGPPGKFYVFVKKVGSEIPIKEIRTDGSRIPVYTQTWHPESASQDRAAVVEAVSGEETAGVDIRLVAKRSLAISGVVTGTPEGPARAGVFLDSEYYGYPQAIPDSEGKFTFSGLSPDHYQVMARYEAVDPPLFSQIVEVALETVDYTAVSLKLYPGEEVSGTLEIEGHPAAERRVVELNSMDRLNSGPFNGGQVGRDGVFHIAPVYPGKFRVRVNPIPENGFIKSVRLDGAEAVDSVVDLSRGVAGSNLKIVIGNGGQVEGTVAIEPDGSARDATVSLAATPDHIEHVKRVEAGKQYRFTALRPGKYRLLVIDPDQGFETQIQAMFPKAPEIEVHEGDRITKDITIPAKESPRAIP